MTNPYEAPEHEAPEQLGAQGPRRVEIRALSRLSDAYRLVGDQYLLFVGICFVGLLLNGVAQNLLLGPIMCGLHLCFSDRAAGRSTSFNRLFQGFDDFLQSFLATLIMFAFVIVLFILVLLVSFLIILPLVAMNDDPNAAGAAFTLFFIPFMVLWTLACFMMYVPMVFVFPLIADRKLTAWEAFKLSWRGAAKNFWGIVGMFFFYWILAIPCALLCYVPLFFVLPLQFGGFFLLYRDVFGLETPALDAST